MAGDFPWFPFSQEKGLTFYGVHGLLRVAFCFFRFSPVNGPSIGRFFCFPGGKDIGRQETRIISAADSSAWIAPWAMTAYS